MPPRKAGPASAPLSPPVMKISQPSNPKRKLPGFEMKHEAKKLKKIVRFKTDIEEQSIPDTVDSLEVIPEEPQAIVAAGTELAETSEEPEEEETLKLEQMYDVLYRLNQECEERRHETRLDSGEIMEDVTPPMSPDSGCSWEFELACSSATDDVGPGDIFDFIWKYVTDHQQDIYRRIGTGDISRDMAETYLRNAPRDLLQILEIAVIEAERKVNQFSV